MHQAIFMPAPCQEENNFAEITPAAFLSEKIFGHPPPFYKEKFRGQDTAFFPEEIAQTKAPRNILFFGFACIHSPVKMY